LISKDRRYAGLMQINSDPNPIAEPAYASDQRRRYQSPGRRLMHQRPPQKIFHSFQQLLRIATQRRIQAALTIDFIDAFPPEHSLRNGLTAASRSPWCAALVSHYRPRQIIVSQA
jgi:hypothetical protein